MDQHRPVYHFLPPANWMNDPNGLIHWQGTYHLFYQHNPFVPYWGPMYWGHAASPDLLRWQHLPIALAPQEGGLDHSGVWSGCAVDWDGVPTLIYTARDDDKEHVCLATSRDGLRSWQRYPGNPVIAGPPPGLDTVGFRDPYAWRDGEGWKLVLGSGVRGAGGMVLLYRSPDLLHWEYAGPLLEGSSVEKEPPWTGDMWECPNFFPLDGKWVLFTSIMAFHPSRSLYTLCAVGDFDGRRFTPQSLVRLDGGDIYFYAPQAFLDGQGRRVAFGWAREARDQESVNQAGWAGVLTLPRLLNLFPDGSLRSRPAPEVESLRGAVQAWPGMVLDPHGSRRTLAEVSGLHNTALEIEAVFRLDDSPVGEIGLLVCRSPGGEEQVEIRCERASGRLVVDTTHASLSPDVLPGVYSCPLDTAGETELRLHVFIDRSLIEVFANERAAITARFYPSRADSTGVAVFAGERPASLERLAAWELHP